MSIVALLALMQAEPAEAAFKDVRVTGVCFVHFDDPNRDIRGFRYVTKGTSLTLLAELPVPAHSVKSAALSAATADTGDDLLLKEPRARVPHIALSSDRTAIVIELHLKPIGERTNGFAEIAGRVAYVVAQKTRDVELAVPVYDGETLLAETRARTVDASWIPVATSAHQTKRRLIVLRAERR